MDPVNGQTSVWALARCQHGTVSAAQLVAFGLDYDAIRHRVSTGRLHRVRRGVYAVGRAELSLHGQLMADVLACGPGAALSHEPAATVWQIRRCGGGRTEVSVPPGNRHRPPGIVVHRRDVFEVTVHRSIPVTTPVATLVDLAARLPRNELEAAVNEADKLGLIDPEALRAAVGRLDHRPGAPALRQTLDIRTFVLTDSELERLYLPIAERAGFPKPETGCYVNGFRADFFYRELGIVVETDGARYHRTPAQQHRDRLRDQAHTAAGLVPLRFTHGQVAYQPNHVEDTLAAVRRLRPQTA
jgi:hypothetical protein